MRWHAAAALWALVLGGPGCALFHREPRPGGTQVGVASWYGADLHGHSTASGERFDQDEFTAAHPSLPLGTRVLVTNLANGRSVRVRINDRGPFVDGRMIDVSQAAARRLGMLHSGTTRVRIEVLGPQSVPPVTGRAKVRKGRRRQPRR